MSRPLPKILRHAFWVGLAVATVAAAPANRPAEEDLAGLQGHWSMVSVERDGQSYPGGPGSTRVAQGDETTVTVGGQLFMKARFTLDPAKKPKAIDYAVTAGPYSGQHQLGIYELQGDTVRFCFAVPGKDRPTEFSTQAGDGRTLSVWKRDSAEASSPKN